MKHIRFAPNFSALRPREGQKVTFAEGRIKQIGHAINRTPLNLTRDKSRLYMDKRTNLCTKPLRRSPSN
jgi:hypothetical protein